MSDMVNHPKHYTDTPFGIEVIEITQHYNFCLGNALKYTLRAGKKWDTIEDLKKAVWYLNREIENREKGVYNGKNQQEQNEDVAQECSGDQRISGSETSGTIIKNKYDLNAGDAFVITHNDAAGSRYYLPQEGSNYGGIKTY